MLVHRMIPPLLLSLAMTAPAFAQSAAPKTASTQTMPTQGTDLSGHEPMSTQASNIDAGDTHTTYAPALPSPEVGPNATPRDLLRAAQQDLAQKHTGAAQQALEMAETRLLDRTVDPSQSSMPDANPMVHQIDQALHMLGKGDVSGAARASGTALAS